ncbi:glycosyltransferase family 4 protein [Legionella sp. km772]|uniref:glycosyltransferase family 4 protein n=1 Tax=Legionella sp. km772 TaxID=2498111 RepID=UPI000F8E63DD|nr:glycosyltransferase family 4 protein [Legionella sp. km772]RUR08855.1 glycosyltransferase family 1 protein [Legionella sp. km772]
MKVVNAMFSKVNGGLEQVFLNYIPTLEQQGNLVIPVIHPKAEILNVCPPQHLRTIHNFNQHDFFAVYKLRKLIQTEQPDCIITHSYRAAYLFKKTRTAVPKIAVCHVQGHYNFGSDAIIAITDRMRQDIIEAGIPEHKVFTVPNMLAFTEEKTYKAPKACEIPVIGVCARFASMKGIDIFLAALAELKQRNVLFKAEIAGDGPEKEHYVKFIRDYQLEKEVCLQGWVNDRDSFYDQLDIFCLPSRREAFGLVILEAMRHSLPLVLTDLPGPREIIADSDSALFSPSEDPISMADNLEQVLKNIELRRRLGLNAFQRVQDYSIASIGPILHDVLKKICHDYKNKTL